LMFKMLIDTCVWLDLAKDPKQVPVLGVVEELLRLSMVSLIVPRVVLDEFRRNRERIARESAKSLSTHFRLVKEAVGKIGGDKKKMRVVLSHLDDVAHKSPIISGEAVGTLDRIEKLLTASPIIETSEAARLRAAQRAIGGCQVKCVTFFTPAPARRTASHTD
jgi:PIN domain